MKVPFTDLTIPKKTVYDILWGLYPVGLFYGMSALVKYNFITRDIDPPQGEVLGMVLFIIPSFILSAALYGPIDSFKRSKRRWGTAIYQFISYPLEFAFYNTLLIGLQAENMPRFMQTNLFILWFVLITSFLERIVLLTTSRPQKIGQEVMQGAFVRYMVILIVYLVSFFLFLRR